MDEELKIFIQIEKKEIEVFNISILKNGKFLDKLRLNKNGFDQFLYFSKSNYEVEVFYHE